MRRAGGPGVRRVPSGSRGFFHSFWGAAAAAASEEESVLSVVLRREGTGLRVLTDACPVALPEQPKLPLPEGARSVPSLDGRIGDGRELGGRGHVVAPGKVIWHKAGRVERWCGSRGRALGAGAGKVAFLTGDVVVEMFSFGVAGKRAFGPVHDDEGLSTETGNVCSCSWRRARSESNSAGGIWAGRNNDGEGVRIEYEVTRTKLSSG